jgi:hypothetical protein
MTTIAPTTQTKTEELPYQDAEAEREEIVRHLPHTD